eukprot:820828-Rhodomonas_salina.1
MVRNAGDASTGPEEDAEVFRAQIAIIGVARRDAAIVNGRRCWIEEGLVPKWDEEYCFVLDWVPGPGSPARWRQAD